MAFITVNDVELYYEDVRGAHATGADLLFLHGWGTSGRVWGAQVAEFAENHRVVTVDWRGCGRSANPLEGNTIDGVTDDLAALITALGLDHPVVVGSSVGGSYATELGLRHPELIGGVVPVDGPSYWPSTGMPVAQLIHDIRYRRAETIGGWVPAWFAPGTSQALIDWTVRQILDSGVHALGIFTDVITYDPRPRLPELRVPIHYVHGEIDTEIPVDVARTSAALTPGARLTVMPGVAHMPAQEDAQAFNAVLHEVLAGLPVPATAAA